MKMSQKQLTEFLIDLGAEVDTNLLERHNEIIQRDDLISLGILKQMLKGISLRARWPSKWVLSVQAGGPNYSNPRQWAEEYISVEIATWPASHHFFSADRVWEMYSGLSLPKYLVDRDSISSLLESPEQVSGWVDWPSLESFAKVIASLPEINMTRQTAPWKFIT